MSHASRCARFSRRPSRSRWLYCSSRWLSPHRGLRTLRLATSPRSLTRKAPARSGTRLGRPAPSKPPSRLPLRRAALRRQSVDVGPRSMGGDRHGGWRDWRRRLRPRQDSRRRQRKALIECAKRAHGAPCTVALCTHSSRRSTAAIVEAEGDPELVAARRAGYVAAIAYSPKTGKIGSTAGVSGSKKEAHAFASKSATPTMPRSTCGDPNGWPSPRLRVGGTWLALPRARLARSRNTPARQAQKLCRDGKCQVTLAVHAAGEPKQKTAAKPAAEPVSTKAPTLSFPAGN